MKVLRMIRNWRIWNAGETAGFPDAVADELIASGVAELAAPEVSEPAPEVSEPAPEPQPAPVRRPGRPRKT
jgi:hypothetical protein